MTAELNIPDAAIEAAHEAYDDALCAMGGWHNGECEEMAAWMVDDAAVLASVKLAAGPGVNVLAAPYQGKHDACRWCVGTPAEARCYTQWDRPTATTDGHEQHCPDPACVQAVVGWALTDSEPEGITIEVAAYPDEQVAA